MTNKERQKMYWRSLFEAPNTKLFINIQHNFHQLLNKVSSEEFDHLEYDYQSIKDDINELEREYPKYYELLISDNLSEDDKEIRNFIFNKTTNTIFNISEFVSRPIIYDLITKNIF